MVGAVAPFCRLAAVVALLLGCGFAGFARMPRESAATPKWSAPVLRLGSSSPQTAVQVSSATLSPDELLLDLSVQGGSSGSALYVEIVGVLFNRSPDLVNPDWTVLRTTDWDRDGFYSVAYIKIDVPAGASHQGLVLQFTDCNCIATDGPFTTVSTLGLPPRVNTSGSGRGEPAPIAPGAPYPVSVSTIGVDRLRPYSDNTGAPEPAEPATGVQALSWVGGEPTETVDGTWQWSNTTFGSATFEDAFTKQKQDDDLFLAGLLFGIAGAAAVALVPEVAEFTVTMSKRYQRSRTRRKARKRTDTTAPPENRETSAQSGFTHNDPVEPRDQVVRQAADGSVHGRKQQSSAVTAFGYGALTGAAALISLAVAARRMARPRARKRRD